MTDQDKIGRRKFLKVAAYSGLASFGVSMINYSNSRCEETEGIIKSLEEAFPEVGRAEKIRQESKELDKRRDNSPKTDVNNEIYKEDYLGLQEEYATLKINPRYEQGTGIINGLQNKLEAERFPLSIGIGFTIAGGMGVMDTVYTRIGKMFGKKRKEA